MPVTKTRFSRLLKQVFLSLVLLVLLLLVMLWVFSPFLVRQQANIYLEPLGYQLKEQASVRLNPFAVSAKLTNIELADSTSGEVYARINNGYVNIDVFPLLDQELIFEDLFFEGLLLQVERQQALFKIAGYPLAIDQTEEGIIEDDIVDTPDWRIDIQNFLVEDFEAVLTDNQQRHTMYLDELKLEDLSLQTGSQQGHIDIVAKLNNADFKTLLDFDLQGNQGSVEMDFKLEGLQVSRFGYLAEDYLDRAQAEISLQFSNTISIRENDLAMTVSDALLKLSNVDVLADDFALKTDTSALTFTGADLAIENGEFSSLEGLLKLSIGKTDLSSSSNIDQLLAFDEIVIPKATLAVDKDAHYGLASEQINLLNVVVSKPMTEAAKNESALPALLAIPDISLKALTLTPVSLALDKVLFSGFESTLVLDQNRDLTNLVAFSDKSGEQVEPESKQSPTDSSFALKLGQFELDQPGKVHVIDHSIEPYYERNYTVDTLSLDSINTEAKTNNSNFALAFSSGKYTKASAEGEVQLFADKANLILDATIREFSLPRISPFVRQAAGFDMLSGQLDSDIKLSVVEDEITGNTALTMRGLEISTANDVNTGSLSEQSFFPLNIALGALKDSDGTINIDIPLSGNINDPDFGVSGFMSLLAQKAALSASQSYLMTTFVPYANVISLTRMVGEYALKVRVDDLIYKATQTDLAETQLDFNQKIVALLNDKEDISLKLCAIATKEDLGGTSADVNDPNTIIKLKEIAQKRGEIFKDQLVESGGINSARILLCQPKIDGQEHAQPRIEFDI